MNGIIMVERKRDKVGFHLSLGLFKWENKLIFPNEAEDLQPFLMRKAFRMKETHLSIL